MQYTDDKYIEQEIIFFINHLQNHFNKKGNIFVKQMAQVTNEAYLSDFTLRLVSWRFTHFHNSLGRMRI